MMATEPGGWQDLLLGGRPVKVSRRGPDGVSVDAMTGSTVYSPQGGTVVHSGYDGRFGHTVVVQMVDGAYLAVSHLSRRDLEQGDPVDPGTKIGLSGASGDAAAPGVWLEVRRKASGGSAGRREQWRFIDPVGYLDERGKGS